VAGEPSTEEIADFISELATLEDSQRTTLELLNRSGSERAWQAMLAYFLDPEQPHHLGTSVLEAFITAIASHPAASLSEEPANLDTAQVATEVSTPPKGRVDILLWEANEWFICIEMKVDAAETGDQTQRYIDAPSLGSLSKSRHAARGGDSQYVYLAPQEASVPTAADEFAQIAWCDIVPFIENIVTDLEDNEYTQSHAQLTDFILTIKKHLTMGEFNSLSEEALLYAKYEDNISRIESEYRAELGRLKEELKKALGAEFQDNQWQTRKRSGTYTWVQLFKPSWHSDAVNIEYEPQFRLGRDSPQIDILLDIEQGKDDLRQAILDDLIDRLDTAWLRDNGWVVTGQIKPCLKKTIKLDIDAPQECIDEVVQAVRAFDTALGHHIDAVVTEHISD
jgi:hypothetical protein